VRLQQADSVGGRDQERMTDDPDVSVDENSEAIAKLPAFALTVGELEAESKNDAMASADSARPRIVSRSVV
jgi:hypothetical protein